MLGGPNTGRANRVSDTSEDAVATDRRRPGDPGADLGFRRVVLVRAWTGPDQTRFEVDGVVHRYPVTLPVTAAMASRLVAAGVPLVVRDETAAASVPC